jgi:hypothetical protein
VASLGNLTRQFVSLLRSEQVRLSLSTNQTWPDLT